MTSNVTTSAARVALVRSIGAAERKSADAAAEIVASVPDTYDWTARGAVPQAVIGWAMADSGSADVPAQRKGPKGAQVTTDFGRGVDALVKAVRAVLAADSDGEPKPAVLRVSLSGEGGGSTVVPADHPLYASLIALLAGDAEDSAAA